MSEPFCTHLVLKSVNTNQQGAVIVELSEQNAAVVEQVS